MHLGMGGTSGVEAQPIAAGSRPAREPDPAATPRRASAVLAPTTLLTHALGYGFVVLASRLLGPADYGIVAALLGIVIIGTVPGLALQAVTARHIALGDRQGADVAALWSGLRRPILTASAATAVLTVVAAPLVVRFLRLPSWTPMLGVVCSLALLPLLSSLHGVLQGQRRFEALGLVTATGATAKLLAGAALIAAGQGAPGAMVGVAAGYALEVMLARRVLARTLRGRRDRTRPGIRREVAWAVAGIAAVVVLANVDLVLARHVLPAAEAGRYAVGAVGARVAYWGPQFVLLIVYPRLVVADDPGRVLGRTALLLAAAGIVGMAVAAAAARPLVTGIFGAVYGPVAPLVWRFVGLGTLLAVLHLLVLGALATGRRATIVVAVAAVALTATAAVTLRPATVGGVLGLMLAGVGTAVVVAGVGQLAPISPRRRRSAP